MEPLHIFFAATGLVFWVLLILSSICIIASIENDSPGGATTTVGVTFGILWLFSDFSHRYVVWHFDWRVLLTYIIGYFIAGIVWSIIKWFLALSNRRERWDEAVTAYRKQYQIDRKETVLKTDPRFVSYMVSNHPEFMVRPKPDVIWTKNKQLPPERIEPRPEPNKARILLWMAYWPWSILWSLLDDVIKNIFRHIYRMLKGIYEGMATWMFSDIQ